MEYFILLISFVGLLVFVVMILQPSAETASIGKRLQGLQASQVQIKTSLRDSEEMNKNLFVRVILPLLDRLSKVLGSAMPVRALNNAKVQIVQAGLTGKITPIQVMTLSYVLLVVMPILILVVTSIPTSLFSLPTAAIFLSAMFGFRLPMIFISGRATTRKNEIQKALPFTLDLISISVEAGMALDGAIAIVREKSRGPLSDELGTTLSEIRLGKSRNEALTDMAERVGVDDLRSFITAVTYIAKLGGSLVDVIRIQSQAMRTKRRQRAEEKAMKTPVKIMIPLVLFIFPSMFVVILGPAGLSMMKSFSRVGH